MRCLRRYLVLGPVVAAAVAFADATPAAAKDTGVCTLLTRSEAGKLLGAKVVKTSKKTSKINDALECTYKTNKAQKQFKDRGAKMQLEVTVQPVTDKLRAELQRIPTNEGERVEGLGDEAYATKFDYVIAVSGNTAVQAKLQNYQGSPTKFRSVSEGAVRTALTRLDRVSVTPPSS
ncbi:MAG TPA: hypothetical protein VGK05_09685 [Acidimicrobiia bacterium]|jgi:hypothetical protein